MKKKENPKSKPYSSFKDLQMDMFEEDEHYEKEKELLKDEENRFLRKKEEVRS